MFLSPSESRLPCDLVYAAAIVARPSNARGARLVSQPHQISGDVFVGQQWSAAETGKWKQAIASGIATEKLEYVTLDTSSDQ